MWMAWGLVVTAVVAAGVANSPSLVRAMFGNPVLLIGLIVAELAMVVGLSAGVRRLSPTAAAALFLVYSALNGLTLSVVFLVYTTASVSTTFFVTAGMFGAMAAYGYLTRRDLTRIGSLCFMALIGLILASVVNWFLASPGLYWLITYGGIAIFVGLTAYDVQKLRAIATSVEGDEALLRKSAILGALALYLDFINLFLLLLRVLGRRR